MKNKMVSFRYTDGRTKPHPSYVINMGEDRVQEMLKRGDPIEVLDGSEDSTPDQDPEDASDTETDSTETAPDGDEKDGWPTGYSFEKTGAYVVLYDPDGTQVSSTTPSGKFKGENAAQEAAWLHKGGA